MRVVNKIRVHGMGLDSCRPVRVTLQFDEERNLLNPQAIARSSMVGWGAWQQSHKVPCSFGDLWWCSTAGHGGFILVTQKISGILLYTEENRPWFKNPAFKLQHGFGTVYVYEFEEDCDWALLVYQDPKVLAAETARYNKNAPGEKQLTEKGFLEQHVLPSVRRWNEWALKDEHKLPVAADQFHGCRPLIAS